jgi:hypothetical protein
MPLQQSSIIYTFKRPVRNVVLFGDLAANDPSVAAIAINVDPQFALAITGLRAEARAFEINPSYEFYVIGLEGFQPQPSDGFFKFFNASNRIYFAEQNFAGVVDDRSVRIENFWNEPVIYYNSGFYTFVAGVVNTTATVNAVVDITLYGRIIDQGGKREFPYQYR